MNQDPQKITELDLLAYADGFLESDPGHKAAVERHIEQDPDAAAYVAEIQAQNEEIRDRFGPLLSEPVPEKFNELLFAERPATHRRSLARAAGVLVLLSASATGGWLIGQQGGEREVAMAEFIEQAASSHEMEIADNASPGDAEVQGATQPLAWLTERISLELQAPNLSSSGYELVAKKQLGPEHDPTVQLIYGGQDGTRMNLFLRPRWEGDEGPLQQAEVEDRTVLYWLEGPLAIAMTVDAPGAAANTLAHSVQGALDRARLNETSPATALTPAAPTEATEQTLGDGLQEPLRPAAPATKADESSLQIN